MRTPGCEWLGVTAYLLSAVAGVLLAYGPNGSTVPAWTMVFHPAQYIGLSFLNDAPVASRSSDWVRAVAPTLASVPGVIWAGGLVLGDLLFVLVAAATVCVAARALLSYQLPLRAWWTAVLFVLATLSLPTLVLLLSSTASSLLADWAPMIVVIVAAAVFVYLTVALVVIANVSTLRALSTLVVGMIFSPIWLVGVGLYAASFAMWRRPPRPGSMAGLIVQPGATLEALRKRSVRPILGMHVVIALLVTAAIAAVPGHQGATIAWAFVFDRAHLPFLYIGVDLAEHFDVELDSVLRGVWDNPVLLAWITSGSVVLSLVFISGVDITARRLMEGRGRFTFLASAFLTIANVGTLFFAPYAAAFWFWTGPGSIHVTSQLDSMAMGYFVLAIGALTVWSALLHVIAFSKVYSMTAGRALATWFTAVALWIPVSLVTLLVVAVGEVARPLRVRRTTRELLTARGRVEQLLNAGEPTRAADGLTALVNHYCGRSEITRRARASVDLAGVFAAEFQVNSDAVLEHICNMAGHADRDVQVTAAQVLSSVLQRYPRHVISSLYWLMGRRCNPSLLADVAADATRHADLAGFLHALVTLLNASNLLELLERADAVTAAWRDESNGEELYLVYHALLELRRATTVVDLERAADVMLRPLSLDQPRLSATGRVLKQLLDISQYLAYYSRAEFENKIPYLAAPMMILVNEAQTLEPGAFPPEDQILRLLVSHLQNIILLEFNGLRRRAALHFDLEPKRALLDRAVSVVLHVRNQGSAGAERVRVRLGTNGVKGDDDDAPGTRSSSEVQLLSPKREARLEFTIHPSEAGRLRVPFEITYDDLERKGRSTEFASLIDLYEPADEAALPGPEQPLVNPYITGLPVIDPAMFFGRQDVFRFVRDNLQGKFGKNILVLRGQRRTGKTSILYQLHNQLDEKFIPVILDIQGFASIGVDRFLHWIAWHISQALEDRGLEGFESSSADFRDDPYGYMRETFLPQVHARIGYHRLLLTFDEFEELDARVRDGKVDKDVFGFLRNLMQHEDWLDFIIAGTYKLQEISSEYWSTLFNIALYKDIGFMTLEDVEQIIRQPVKERLSYDDLAIAKIARVTAGHPYFVQIFGSKLVDEYRNRGTFYFALQDVNRVIDAVLDGGSMQFEYLWRQSTPVEQVLLAAMAENITREDGAVTLGELERLFAQHELAISETAVLAAASTLVTRELIITDAKFREFEFKIDLVRLWLERYKPFGVVFEGFRHPVTERELDQAREVEDDAQTASRGSIVVANFQRESV